MKKFIILTAVLPLVLSSCLKDDADAFDITASERIREVQVGTEKVLTDAPNGWLMEYYPSATQEYGGVTIYMKFNEGGVTVTSERGGADKTAHSLYSYDQDYGPTINFDSYNPLFHFYSEPDVGIGDKNKGMGGDSEFTIVSYAADKVVLRGKKTQNDIVLTPLPEGVWTTQFQNYLDVVAQMDGMSSYEFALNGTTYEISRDAVPNYNSRYFTIYTSPETKVSFIYTTTGLKFYKPLVIDGVSIDEMEWKNGAFVDEASGARIQKTGSANQFTITVSDIGPLSAKIKVDATIPEEYFYMGAYEKDLELGGGNSDADIINSLMNNIKSVSNLSKGSSAQKDLALKSSTEYVPCAFGVKVVEGSFYPITALFKGTAFSTLTLTPADYGDWLGTWTVTSASSEKSGAPMSFDVVISKKVEGSTYSVRGWDTTDIRLDFPATADFDADDNGALKFSNYQEIGSNHNGPHYFLAEILYPDVTGYYLATENYNLDVAMSGALDNSRTKGYVNGVSAVDPQGDSYLVTTMLIAVKQATGWGTYGPAPGLPDDNPVGPFTMVKKSASGAPAVSESNASERHATAPVLKTRRVKELR